MASFAYGHTTASVVMKRLVGFGPKNRLYRATRELGRVFKTEFMRQMLSASCLLLIIASIIYWQIITTDVGGLAEALSHEEAGLIVPPEDPEALAESIVHFFKEEGLQEELSAGVRWRKQRASLDELLTAIEALP